MSFGWMVGALLLGAFLITVLVVGWLMLRRPLELWDWGTRRALARTGLEKRVIPSPAGPQTVFVGGSGPALVFLHGAGHQAGTWLQSARALRDRYTLVIPDLAGHGESAPVTGPIQAVDIVNGLEAAAGAAHQVIQHMVGDGGHRRQCAHAAGHPRGGPRHHGPPAGRQQPRHPRPCAG